jgi:glycosyltransferase involved in cell wall biosynthesis
MHLLINGLSARLGGGQTYLNQLLRHLPDNWQVTLLTSGGLGAETMPAQVRLIALPQLRNPLRRSWWERRNLESFAESLDCDLLFTPACILPPMRRARLKTAVIFQNMLPFDPVQRRHYPLISYRRLRDFLLERAMLSAMRRADLVIFISAYARDYMAQHYGINPTHSALIPHAIDPMFFAPAPDARAPLPDDFPCAREPYFLYVSFLDFYKCQREVIRAYAALRAQHAVTTKLVLVGTPYHARYAARVREDIATLGLADCVVLLGHVPHTALPALYQHATLNLFASITENCPNILMEIMAAGRPALVSHHGPMPEIAGDTVTYADPTDHAQWVSQWAHMLRTMDAAEANAKRAIARVRGYRWHDTAQQTWAAMAAIMPTAETDLP